MYGSRDTHVLQSCLRPSSEVAKELFRFTTMPVVQRKPQISHILSRSDSNFEVRCMLVQFLVCFKSAHNHDGHHSVSTNLDDDGSVVYSKIAVLEHKPVQDFKIILWQ
jgi:hypothetical protein